MELFYRYEPLVSNNRSFEVFVNRSKWDQCVGTSRYGLFQSQPSSSWADGVVNNSKVDSALQNHNWYAKYDLAGSCQPIQDVVYRLFSDNWKSWKQFSTTQYNKSEPPVGQDFLSLEFIHNNIHVCGCEF